MNHISELSMVVVNTCWNLALKMNPAEIQKITATVDQDDLITNPWDFAMYEQWYVDNFGMHFPLTDDGSVPINLEI